MNTGKNNILLIYYMQKPTHTYKKLPAQHSAVDARVTAYICIHAVFVVTTAVCPVVVALHAVAY